MAQAWSERVEVLDLETGKIAQLIKTEPLLSGAFSPDLKRFARAGEHGLWADIVVLAKAP